MYSIVKKCRYGTDYKMHNALLIQYISDVYILFCKLINVRGYIRCCLKSNFPPECQIKLKYFHAFISKKDNIVSTSVIGKRVLLLLNWFS